MVKYLDMKKKLISCFLIIIFIAFIAFILIKNHISGDLQRQLQSISGGADKYTFTSIDLFDTKTDIVGYSDSEEQFAKDSKVIIDKLTYYNRIYDIYNDYEGVNNVKTINDNAGVAPVKVDKELIDMLKFGKQMYYETDGRINIAMGSVLSIWHNYREAGLDIPKEAKLPSKEELEDAAEHTNIEDMVIDEKASTVFLKDERMSLDVGAVAKGYAVQQTLDYARSKGMDNILLNVGGNISCIGGRTDGSKFMVAIQNPDLESDEPYVEAFEIEDGECVVSSGDYQRYYEVDGKKYCHIINPDTLFPSDEFAQVSILAKDSGVADGFSTALFNMSLEDGKEFIAGYKNVEAMWVMPDGSKVYTQGFKDYIK